MAIIKKLSGKEEKVWNDWVATRPKSIQEMCVKYPPNLLYRLKSNGNKVVLFSYEENETVTVIISDKYNNNLAFERKVFGINPKDLVECDLPD